jgi:predicted phosphodiesterase
MRIAAIYDIQGNLPALEAVIQDILRAGVDRIVIGGDVLPGPMPRETLACLLDLGVPTQFIYGNGETAVLEVIAGREPAAVPETHRPIILWTAQQLPENYKSMIANWPATVLLEVGELGRVLFCHATPRNDNQIFTRLTPEEHLLPIFAGLNADIVVLGHTHMQLDRMVGKTRVVNAGSVGMPFGTLGADWLLLGPDVQLRHSSYDLSNAAERVRKTDYPQADEFATRHVLQTPSEEEMLAAFAKVELK